MKRSPLRRSTKPLKRRSLRRVSKKRKSNSRAYTELRKRLLKERPYCEIDGTLPSEDLHHIKGRRGDLYLDEDNILCLSRKMHNMVHFGSCTLMPPTDPHYEEWKEHCDGEPTYGPRFARHFGYLK